MVKDGWSSSSRSWNCSRVVVKLLLNFTMVEVMVRSFWGCNRARILLLWLLLGSVTRMALVREG